MTDATRSAIATPSRRHRLLRGALLAGCWLAAAALPLIPLAESQGHYGPWWPITNGVILLGLLSLAALGWLRLGDVATLPAGLKRGLGLGLTGFSLLLLLWLGWDVAVFVLLGLGASLSWALVWSENTSAVMLDSTRDRVIWALYAFFVPPAFLLLNLSYTLTFDMWGLHSNPWQGWLLWTLCAAYLAPGMVRSIRARRRARRYLAIQDGTIEELEPV